MIATTALQSARILIVDDHSYNVSLIEHILRMHGYSDIHGTTASDQVVALFETLRPDLLVLDLHMPGMDGFAVMEALGPHIPADDYFPILVVTADITIEAKRRALSIGARDFLNRPFDTIEVLLRIKNLLETRFLQLQLHNQNLELEAKVRQRTHEIEQAQIEILQRLALAAEFRDDNTGQHTQRVSRLAARLANELGLPQEQVELIGLAASLHDLGKIGIPDHLLLKPGQLTIDEFAQMKGHTAIGARILSGSRYALLRLAEEIAYTHHERWDGAGYPCGLAGEAIPLAGRIVAAADAFDVLTNDRPYKLAWSVDDALDEIARQSGDKFDPRIVVALLHLYGKEIATARRSELLELVSQLWTAVPVEQPAASENNDTP